MVKTVAERIAVMETKVEIIETKVDSLHVKLDHFIECADTKYAEKQRVNYLEAKVNAHDAKLAYYAGSIAVIFVVVQLAMKHFLG